MEEAWELAAVSEGNDNASELPKPPDEEGRTRKKAKSGVGPSFFFGAAFIGLFLFVIMGFLSDSLIISGALEQVASSVRNLDLDVFNMTILAAASIVAIKAGFARLGSATASAHEAEPRELDEEKKSWFEKLFSSKEREYPASRIFTDKLFVARFIQGKVTEDWRDFLLTSRFRYLFEAERFERNSAIYLTIGSIISAIAIGTLFVLALGDISSSAVTGTSDWGFFLPRLTFAILIQSLGFFFLRRHVVYERQRQRCYDIVTQIEFRLGSGALAKENDKRETLISALALEKVVPGAQTQEISEVKDSSLIIALLAALAGKKGENG